MLKTLWHRILGKLFEIVLSPVGVTILSELPATSNPPLIDILLLRREGTQWTPQQMALLPDGVRDRHVAHHLLECKLTESVNEESFQQALTYDYLYRQSQQLAADKVQTYIVSAHTPRRANLEVWGYQVSEHPGVYVSSLPLLRRVVLLVLNELRDAPHNDFLRVFASRQKVREAALQVLLRQPWTRWPTQFGALLFGLQRMYKVEGADMRKEWTVEDVIEIGEEMRKQVIASAAPEERLQGLAPEERLQGLAPEELQVLLKQLEAHIGQSAIRSTTAEEVAMAERRQTLIHVLQHKFGELPPTVVERITVTADQAQLTEWLDSALDVETLTAIDFGP
ncbi:MAG: hypothetical protein R3E79_49020 [Caldilineaceae bacterium]